MFLSKSLLFFHSSPFRQVSNIYSVNDVMFFFVFCFFFNDVMLTYCDVFLFLLFFVPYDARIVHFALPLRYSPMFIDAK